MLSVIAMSLSISESQILDEDGSVQAFEATISDVRNVIQLLKAINFKDVANVFLTSSGIKVTVEDAKCVQANSFIQAELFNSFILREDAVSFRINLNTLLDCLHIFGHINTPGITPSLKIAYDGYGSPLSLLVDENDVYTECSIKTCEPDEVVFFDFSHSNVVNKIIMKSEYLKDTFAELDTSSEYLQIQISSQYPHFRLSTIGFLSSFHIECPESSDVMEHFECTKTQTNKYNTMLMKPAAKALALSTKVSIRTDDKGLLCLQFLILVGNQHECFVEYYCSPNVEME